MIVEAFWPGWLLTAGAGGRTIAGVAVPWNEPGVVATGRTVIFEPGALDPASRPVALRDHDRGRPVGMVVDAGDTGTGMTATVRASRTTEGDDALALAGDGALMFSVGVEPTEFFDDADGVLHVTAGDWRELSLLTFGAFAGARISTVTATQGATMTDTATTADVTDVLDDADADAAAAAALVDQLDDQTEPGGQVEVVEAAGRTVPITAGRRAGVAVGRHPYAGVGLRELSLLINASAGDDRARRMALQVMSSPGARAGSVNAALTSVTLVGTDNVGAAYRPGYQAELVELVDHGSPVVQVLRPGTLERGDYPNKTFNQWTKTPQVALQTAEKTQINSTPVGIGPASVPVKTWATGNDLSQQLLDFGSPSFVEDYIRAAGIDYASEIELYAVTALLAAATAVTTVAGDTFLEILQKLLGAIDPTKVPAGGLFCAVSWDVWVTLVGVTEQDGPAFWSGSISLGTLLPSTDMGGLTIIWSPGMPARTVLLGLRNAATWYQAPGVPYSLRAVNVGLLGLDVGVYGYGAVGVQHPYALVKTTVPVGP